MKELTAEWMKKAEDDLLVAKREFEEPPVYDAVCFHSQQCVEKCLKAVLQENDVYFEKTHDLYTLLNKCKVFIPELLNYKIELIELSSFAVEVRYPGTESNAEEAEKSLLVADKIIKIVRSYMENGKQLKNHDNITKIQK